MPFNFLATDTSCFFCEQTRRDTKLKRLTRWLFISFHLPLLLYHTLKTFYIPIILSYLTSEPFSDTLLLGEEGVLRGTIYER